MHFGLKLVFLCYWALMVSPLKLLQLTPAFFPKEQIYCIKWNQKKKKLNPDKCFAQAACFTQMQVTGVCAVASAVVSRVAADLYRKHISWKASGFHAGCCNNSLTCWHVCETDIYFLTSVIGCWSNFRKLMAVQFIKWRDNSDTIQKGHLQTHVTTYLNPSEGRQGLTVSLSYMSIILTNFSALSSSPLNFPINAPSFSKFSPPPF